MWNTIKAEFKWIFSSKWRIAEYILMLFIPFVYAFLYMNAYWNPFGHVDKLKIVLVNLDGSQESEEFQQQMIAAADEGITSGSKIYEVDIDVVDDIHSNAEAEEYVNNNEAQAAIVISPDFTAHGQEFRRELAAIAVRAGINIYNGNPTNIDGTVDEIAQAISNKGQGEFISFYNSVKHSYLAAEITNFGGALANFEYGALLPTADDIKFAVDAATNISDVAKTGINLALDMIQQQLGGLSSLVNTMKVDEIANMIYGMMNPAAGQAPSILAQLPHISIDELKTIIGSASTVLHIINDGMASGSLSLSDTSYSPAKNVDTYGFGLSPYFLCIGLWAGALVMIFLFKNERHTKGESTLKHYFGKYFMWMTSGWVQSIIVVTAIWTQGVDLGADQWMLYLMGIFISTIFTAIVQAIAFAFRYGDMGEFVVVILLVIQLTSSSGTFPYEMQHAIFKFLHPIAPFTYGIKAVREIFYEPSTAEIFKNLGIMLAFPAIFMSIAIPVNWFFDRRTRVIEGEAYKYQSYEIEMDDM